MGQDATILVFWRLSFKSVFSSSLSAIRVTPAAYLRLLVFLPAILIPACASSSPVFHMMCSTYKLKNQGDNIQPFHTPFPILNQSIVLCPVLTVASWPASRFLKRHVRRSGIPNSFKNFPQFVVIFTVKGFSIANEAKVDVFLEFSCFLNDPTNVGNLTSGSSAFGKSSLYIWKFSAHVLLKPNVQDLEHYLAGLWNGHSRMAVWTFFALSFFGPGMITHLPQSCGQYWVFQTCCHTECNILTVSSFRIWNSSAGIPSPRLALFVVMLP